MTKTVYLSNSFLFNSVKGDFKDKYKIPTDKIILGNFGTVCKMKDQQSIINILKSQSDQNMGCNITKRYL